jgi:hypothetical protein
MSYKILSLDGGGSWALVQAKVLHDLYGDISGHQLLRKFDMAISNSGGSLVLACLCNDMKLGDIASVFLVEADRRKVFSALPFWKKITRIFDIGPKYSAEKKLPGLREVLTAHDKRYQSNKNLFPIVDTPLEQLPEIIGKKDLQIVIASFDYYRQRANFLRSNLRSLTNDFNRKSIFSVTLGHAIHASSNAPVNYFDDPASVLQTFVNNLLKNGKAESRKTALWDGGVSGFNNPVLAGLVEAHTNFPAIPFNEYRILSLGTGTGSGVVINDFGDSSDDEKRMIYNKNKGNPLAKTDVSTSLAKDVAKLAKSILADPPDSATFIAYAMMHPELHNQGLLVRINPCINPVINNKQWYVAPNVYSNKADDFERLIKMDMDAVEQKDVDLIATLCTNFIVDDPNALFVPNQFIRGDENSDKKLGYGSYREAKARWKAIEPPI